MLKVNHNNVRDSGIPSDLFKVKELVTVDLSHNNLNKLPEALVQAANLIVLSLSHNNISSVPGAVSVCVWGGGGVWAEWVWVWEGL